MLITHLGNSHPFVLAIYALAGVIVLYLWGAQRLAGSLRFRRVEGDRYRSRLLSRLHWAAIKIVDPGAFVREGIKLESKERFDEALNLYEEALHRYRMIGSNWQSVIYRISGGRIRRAPNVFQLEAAQTLTRIGNAKFMTGSYPEALEYLQEAISAGIPQIKPTFLGIAPSGIPSNIIPHSKGVKCGLIRSNSPFSYSNHRPAKPKIPKPLVYAQVSPLGTSFATP